jgi:hypothetical protein
VAGADLDRGSGGANLVINVGARAIGDGIGGIDFESDESQSLLDDSRRFHGKSDESMGFTRIWNDEAHSIRVQFSNVGHEISIIPKRLDLVKTSGTRYSHNL